MDFELKKNSINKSVLYKSLSVKENLDLQINLPDYCSDIGRILKCSVQPEISAVSLRGDKLNALGTAVVRLIYVSEEGKLDSYETESDLSFAGDIENPPENAAIKIKAKTDYTNCRAMSQRKVSVSAAVTLTFSLFTEKKTECVCGSEREDLQLKKIAVKTENLICQGEKSFDLGETVSLESAMPDIGKIISVKGYCKNISQKSVTGKLLLKGDLVADIAYLPDKEENKICKLTHTLPINQIIDLIGADEKSNCKITADICKLIVNIKPDSAGKNRLFEIAARVSAFSKCKCEKETELTLDCYSTDYEVTAKYETEEFLSFIKNISEEKQLSKSFELNKAIGEILHVFPLECSVKSTGSENTVKFFSECLVGVLYLDEKGNAAYTEKNLESEFEERVGAEYEKLVCEPVCTFFAAAASAGKDSVDITADIKITGDIYFANSKKFCKDIVCEENDKKVTDNPALTVCYSQKGEKLWDIAKKYNTTVKSIKEENLIKEEVLGENKMLMIC